MKVQTNTRQRKQPGPSHTNYLMPTDAMRSSYPHSASFILAPETAVGAKGSQTDSAVDAASTETVGELKNWIDLMVLASGEESSVHPVE
jgi:hypothetical protein